MDKKILVTIVLLSFAFIPAVSATWQAYYEDWETGGYNGHEESDAGNHWSLYLGGDYELQSVNQCGSGSYGSYYVYKSNAYNIQENDVFNLTGQIYKNGDLGGRINGHEITIRAGSTKLLGVYFRGNNGNKQIDILDNGTYVDTFISYPIDSFFTLTIEYLGNNQYKVYVDGVQVGGIYDVPEYSLLNSIYYTDADDCSSTTNGNAVSRFDNFNITVYNQSGVFARFYDTQNTLYLNNFSYEVLQNSVLLSEGLINDTDFISLNGTGNYSVTFNKSGYETTIENYSHDNTNQYLTLNTAEVPNINITFYDLLTNDLINNVSMVFDGDNNYFTSNTITGKYFSDTLSSDYYRIFINSEGYASNNYYINLTPSTAGVINAYLVNLTGANEIDITLQDTSQVAVQDALVSAYFRNGSNLKLVGTGRSNIIGKSTFNLNPDYTHTFIIQASGYDTKTFSYLPTEDITVTLSDTSTVTYETILDTISYSYTPTANYLTGTSSQDFTFTVSDSNSQIQSFSLSFYNGSETVSGSASGGIATLNVNTSNYVGQSLLFYYNITRIDGETYEATHSYYILGSDAGNVTGQYAFTNTGYSDRALSMLAVLFIGLLMLGLAKSGFSGLLITIVGVFGLALFTWLGWVNAWLGYSTVIIVMLYLLFRGGLFE